MPTVGLRAAEYAGWWGGKPQVIIDVDTTITNTVYQTPVYSILVDTSSLGWQVVTSGDIDLTGYSSLTGFNNQRSTAFATVYLDWPATYTAGDNAQLNIYNELRDSSTTYYDNMSITWNESLSKWEFSGPQINLQVSGTFTTYQSRWITYGFSTAETKNAFSNWTGPADGSGTTAVRVWAYNTETGALLGKIDSIIGSSPLPTISSLPNPLPTSGSANSVSTGGFGGTQSTYAYRYRYTTVWNAFGTMFDPLQQTDKTFLTLRPSSTIGTAVAWQNIVNSDYTTYSTKNYTLDNSYDLYSQTNNLITRQNGYTSSEWTSVYSNTIFPKDSS